MTGLRWLELSDEERDAFLGDGGTGTLSFAMGPDEPPYAIPISYGYDDDSGSIYFRLAVGDEGGKSDLLDRPVAFTTHRETDAGWRSVVARGRLDSVSDKPYESSAVQRLWGVQIPLVDIFEEPPADVDFRHYRLFADSMTGRKAVDHEE